ncbi:hypothetical protein ACFFRR_011547 [Megaselia abdita]
MNFKVFCIFATLAIVAYGYPYEVKDEKSAGFYYQPFDDPTLDNYEPESRFRRSPKDDDKKKEKDPEFRFKMNAEDSKQDGKRLQGQVNWNAYESENGRHKVQTYGQGYVREGGEKFRYNPNMKKDSDYKYGATYEYTCC